jgi:hypothetical protein
MLGTKSQDHGNTSLETYLIKMTNPDQEKENRQFSRLSPKVSLIPTTKPHVN